MNPKISIVIPTKDRTDQLRRLLDSIKKSTFTDYEVIVVNDGSTDIANKLKEYNIERIITNEQNSGLAFSRNAGAHVSRGKYILFVDDDNVVDKNMLDMLFTAIETHKELIAVGPITYFYSHPEKLWFLGGGVNLSTSRAYFYTEITKERLFSDELFLTENMHNCFLIRKALGDSVGWFDKKIFMGGTEFDLFMRIKKKYPKHLLATHIKAKCFHDISLKENNTLRNLGFENKRRVYYYQRNRAVFVKRYGTTFNIIALSLVYYPLFLLVYSTILVSHRRIDYFIANLQGVKDGYKYLVFNRL